MHFQSDDGKVKVSEYVTQVEWYWQEKTEALLSKHDFYQFTNSI